MEGTPAAFMLVSWWYGDGLVHFLAYDRALFVYIYDMFSVEICLRTLFSVWRRDQISYEGLTLQEKFQAWSLNMASRFIGFIVKSATLFSYLLALSLLALLTLISILFWLLFPLIVAGLFYFGLRMIFING